MRAEDYLEQHGKIADMIERNKAEYKSIMNALDLVGIDYSKDRVQSPINDVFAETIARAESRLKAIESDLKRLFEIQEEICETIKKVRDERLELLLTLHYIALLPWEKVAEEMDIARSTVYLWRIEALKKVDEILKGER